MVVNFKLKLILKLNITKSLENDYEGNKIKSEKTVSRLANGRNKRN
jgi:hypothetical protein